MPFLQKLSVNSPLSEGSIWPITDTTGIFHPSDNPTGYGAPNPERSSLRISVLADKRDGDDRAAAVVFSYPSGTTPADAATWHIETPEIALYDILLIAAPEHNIEESYAKNNVRYDPGTKTYYVAKTAVPAETLITDTVFWKPIVFVIDYPLTLDSGATGAYFDFTQRVYTFYAHRYIGIKTGDLSQTPCTDTNAEKRMLEIAWDRIYLRGAEYKEGFGEIASAGIAIEHLKARMGENPIEGC